MKILPVLFVAIAAVSCQIDDDTTNMKPVVPNADVLDHKWTNDGLNKDSDTYKEVAYFVFGRKYAEMHSICTDVSGEEEKTVTVIAKTTLDWWPGNVLFLGKKNVEKAPIGDEECISSVGGYVSEFEVDAAKGILRLKSLESVSPTIVLRRM